MPIKPIEVTIDGDQYRPFSLCALSWPFETEKGLYATVF